MLIEKRQEPRQTCLIATPTARPVCTIIKGIRPPKTKDGRRHAGIFLAYSPLTRRVVVGSDYIDAFFKYNRMPV